MLLVGDAPDGAVAVFGDEQGSIVRDGYSDGTASGSAIIDAEAGGKSS
jgi:hypothetical protein